MALVKIFGTGPWVDMYGSTNRSKLEFTTRGREGGITLKFSTHTYYV